jgi:hypothetical protein
MNGSTMNEPRSDGYLILAVGIATTAVFATIAQSFQLVRDFNPETTATLSIIGGAFAQICLALSMLCAVIIGRHMVAKDPTEINE